MSKWTRAVFDCECTSLSPTRGRVIAIGVLKTSEQGEKEGHIFHTRDRVVDPEEGKDVPTSSEEKRVIKEFVDYVSDLKEDAELISYNGDKYDFPFLIGRAMNIDDYGDTVQKLFQLKEQHSLDLIKTEAAKKPNGYPYSLEDLLEKNGLSHNGEISGQEVPEYFQEGDVKKIVDYLKEDVKTTDRLASIIL